MEDSISIEQTWFSLKIDRNFVYIIEINLFDYHRLVIEQIKTQLTSQWVSLQSKVWVFFSAFDGEGKLLASNGVIKTDRPLEQILQSFYMGILKKFEPSVKKIIFDFVEEIRLQNDPNVLIKLPLDQYWLFLVEGEWQNSWVMLPNTKWVTSIQEALTAIKKKYNLNNQVSVFVFKTKKVWVNLWEENKWEEEKKDS